MHANIDTSKYEPRTTEYHRISPLEYCECNTCADQHEIEHTFGVCYSSLLQLSYFDAGRMCTIDPMHNLWLGTAKHVIETWKNLSVLDSKTFDSIQWKVDSFVSPPDHGHVPTKIASGFAGFTVEEWRNWTLYFSLFALKDTLPRQHFNYWHLFVMACFLLCCRSVHKCAT